MADLKTDGRHFEILRAVSSQSGLPPDVESLSVASRTPAIDPGARAHALHEVLTPGRSLRIASANIALQDLNVGYHEYRLGLDVDTTTQDVRLCPTLLARGRESNAHRLAACE